MVKIIAIFFILLTPFLFTDCQCGDADPWSISDAPSSSPYDRAVSRTTGVAPLAVHFFSEFVHSATGNEKERIDRFHHYDYTWNFDSTGVAVDENWGTTSYPKETAKGAIAAHIFETPGDYTVTLSIRDHSGEVGNESYNIHVDDPDLIYSATTKCVNDNTDNNFGDCPSADSADHIQTNDLSTITEYATSGSRILFKRGNSWTVAALLDWPNNAGPVTIGAYGTTGTNDAQGINSTAPEITVNGGTFLSMEFKQNWRVMDLHLIDSTRSNYSISGAVRMQSQLFLRLKIQGFFSGLTWSSWNDASLMPKNDMVVASCNISDSSSNDMYVGSQRLALLGNILSDPRDSHVIRVWQAYRSVISHNRFSGSSIASDAGRHALKFHGPGNHPTFNNFGKPVPHTDMMDVRSEYVIISDNVFGTSGPWPVAIGPQNAYYDERLRNIIVERNRFSSDYGNQSSTLVQVALHLWARHCTARNNIFDGTGSSINYAAIVVEKHSSEPYPTDIEIFNNTVYRGDAGSSQHIGFIFMPGVTNSEVKNNLVSFPLATGTVTLLEDQNSNLDSSNNLLTDNAVFADSNVGTAAIDRDFSLQGGSPALMQGTTVPVYDDFDDLSSLANPRLGESSTDLGALEQ